MFKQAQEIKEPATGLKGALSRPTRKNPDPLLSRSARVLFEVAQMFQAHHQIIRKEILFDALGRRRYFIWEREDGVIAILCQHLGKPSGFRQVAYRQGRSMQEVVRQMAEYLQSPDQKMRAGKEEA